LPGPRVGVYVCHCGSNIADKVDMDALRDFAAGLPDVVVSRDYKYMCSDPGQDLIKADIKEQELDRVVVASCSPRMHEPTFKRACQVAGLNPYLMEMANIREQCSWVTVDKGAATVKAKALVHSAVNKARLLEPLEDKSVPVDPKTLIVGGGIAGIEAALKIAEAGHKVFLVEREPSIGGQMAKLDKTFPTLDCAACILTPKMVSVQQNPNITLLTHSEIENVSGYVGNFEVTIRKRARCVDEKLCNGCGTCQEKCPIKVPNEFEEGMGLRKAIYTPFPQAVPNKPVIDKENCTYYKTGKCRVCERVCPPQAVRFDQEDEIVTEKFGAIIVATGYEPFDPAVGRQWGYGRNDNVITGLQFERLSNASGPTGGKVILKDGTEPKAVAIFHCVGSRDKNYNEYCSRICCMTSVKFAHLVREKTGAKVYDLYMDMRTFGKQYEEFYNRVVAERDIYFIRGKGAEVLEDPVEGGLLVRVEDTLLGVFREIPVDMVILNVGMCPRSDSHEVAQKFNIQRSADGFFLEYHLKLEPMKTANEGVFIAGTCQAPKDIPDTVGQGAGAAAEALKVILLGKVTVTPTTAEIRDTLCSGCRMCIPLCPYTAISFNEAEGVAEVNEALCKGCGTCAASCPSGALRVRHFDNRQLFSQIEGVCAE
jgi:heterodisulfide reductase subunit A